MRTLTRDEARRVYDRVGEKQDAQGWYEDAAVDVLLAHGAFEEATHVVEVGCGTGRLAAQLLQQVLPPSATYLASDPSDTMRQLARQRLAPFGQRASVVDAFGMPTVAPGTASHVIATYVLDLLSEADAQALVDQAHVALAPGGRLCLAGLTKGNGPVSMLVAAGWRAVFRARPQWVGGCRPVEVLPLLGRGWDVVHHQRVTPWGIPSEALVAVRQEASKQVFAR